MKKKTVILIYSAVPLLTGLLILLLGFVLGDIQALNEFEGSETLSFLIKLMGAVMGVAGLGGTGWAISLSENPDLPGYAGLNGLGLIFLVVPLLFLGPFWLLLAWALWLTPPLRA
ncbi:MAG: hypothetical protein ABEK84_10870 [Salinibacter sp.]